jgi:hypothetical protein
MKRMIWLWLLLVFALAYGQEATELYIPIGKSPGISGKISSMVGNIEKYIPQIRTLAINNDGEEHVVRITNSTKIYLDRSKVKKTNLVGSEKDFKSGRLCEVHFEFPGRREVKWIKVEVLD